ncbi:MAG: hypothetical protein KUL88_15450 [Rhizobium sp.]|nr:hypothetical protein [Rhizobium sp.]
MGENGKDGPFLDQNIVQPTVTRLDLDRIWIGLGAAIEWIELRGMPMPVGRYVALKDAAAAALVAVLADLPSDIAESLVRGADEDAPGPLVSIPSGIWRQTATADARFEVRLYLLVGTDDDDERDGAILAPHLPGFRRVQIRADFILDNWPEHVKGPQTRPIKAAVAGAKVRRAIDLLLAMTPPDLAPLTQRDISDIIKRCLPDASRDVIREIAKARLPSTKPGPRGSRDKDRAAKIAKLSDEFRSAQLPN